MQKKAVILVAALSAAVLSGASARDATSQTGYVAPPGMEDGTTNAAPTPSQEDAIPYHPCRLALGWRNGHVVCDNRN
jgi:hypothetical protein